MANVPWTQPINFASALLLHSCVTVLLKELLNLIEISRRLLLRWWYGRQRHARAKSQNQIATSIVLDGYSSLFSNDHDGELAELYFTNTGFVLLAISLASSLAMNILLESLVLNMIVAGTFGLAFVASCITNKKSVLLPILALRRAGRFIWSDTPFVNFFSLIYIATVLRGQATLRLQDYIIFRATAIVELVFMKARLAACSPDTQVGLMRRLIDSEWVALGASLDQHFFEGPFAAPDRGKMEAFTTAQRLSVMLLKTKVGFDLGGLQGAFGPAACPLPDVKFRIGGTDNAWVVYRYSEDVMLLADRFAGSTPESPWKRFLATAHGVLLRRLGKVRVVYILRASASTTPNGTALWHSNVNLVTGVSAKWLETDFRLAQTHKTCIIA